MFCAEDGRFLCVRGAVVMTVPLSVRSLSAFQDDNGWFSLLLAPCPACSRTQTCDVVRVIAIGGWNHRLAIGWAPVSLSMGCWLRRPERGAGVNGLCRRADGRLLTACCVAARRCSSSYWLVPLGRCPRPPPPAPRPGRCCLPPTHNGVGVVADSAATTF